MANEEAHLHQEPEITIINNQEDPTVEFSTLCINNNNNPPPQHHRHPYCTVCGCSIEATANPMKRRSPEPTTPLYSCEPKSKKALFLEPQETLLNNNEGLGQSSFPLLRRSVSDPLPPRSPPESACLTGGGSVVTPHSSAAKGVNASSGLPPRPPTALRRTNSDPTPSSSSPAKVLSRSSSSREESPNYKKLKMLKECMRELCHCYNEVLSEGGEEDTDRNTKDTTTTTTAAEATIELQDEIEEAEPEEAVSIAEKCGEVIVKISCPCGRGYQLLFFGRKCYYKIF